MPSAPKNCFDPMRHLAALTVLVSHHFALSRASEPSLNPYFSWGSIAVLAFFSISGYLITQSFLSSNSTGDYFKKRCARIFPALIACSFLMVYPGQILFGGQSFSTALSDIGNVFMFLKISLFGRADISNITEGFRFTESFNGSLWSLKIEFACYVLIAIGLMVTRKAISAYALTLAAILGTLVLLTFATGGIADKLAIYGSVTIAFLTGSVLYFSREKLLFGNLSIPLFAIALIISLLLWNTKYILVAGGVAFSFIFLWFGLKWGDRVIRRKFDYSYGMYIYAFPVQQILINKTEFGFTESLIAAVIVTTILAALSWHFIESPALRFVHERTNKKVVTNSPKTA
ncbi:acyltransferase family protein [Pseudomonas sp. PDM20]|uniref:acyltransferase family protein n=1 Tax=Pseudomonas sp. PDM20 TaxID=2769254 RepID=UPI001782FAD9|nr:acyltransferase [Pseudomonas sp. PDM20]MBD9686840.1 acyltransferase [Pseudomonas sp. PDM20]